MKTRIRKITELEKLNIGEFKYFEHLLDVYPKGIVSIVSDTWSLFNVISNYLPKLKDGIMQRDGKVVIRPDSGDPVKILCGEKYSEDLEEAYKTGSLYYNSYSKKFYEPLFVYHEFKDNSYDIGKEVILTDEQKGVVELLWEIFGGTKNKLGYKVLDSHIGYIYGDSITPERAEEISKRLADKGFANTGVFGVGSFSYQYVTRDQYNFAVKATYGEINHQPVEIFKDPITDSGMKKSAKGLLCVYADDNGKILMKDGCTKEEEQTGLLETVFLNGKLVKEQTLAEIRKRVLNPNELELV